MIDDHSRKIGEERVIDTRDHESYRIGFPCPKALGNQIRCVIARSGDTGYIINGLIPYPILLSFA